MSNHYKKSCWVYHLVIQSNFYDLEYKTSSSIICYKLVKFSLKAALQNHCSANVWNCWWPRLTQTHHNWWRNFGIWLWHWNKNTIVLMKASWRTMIKYIMTSEIESEGSPNTFLLLQCIIYYRFVPRSYTITKNVLPRSLKLTALGNLKKLPCGPWFLNLHHHDNILAHTSTCFWQKVTPL